MASPAEIYVNGIRKKIKTYYAAWLPNEELLLGDVGVISDNFFTRVTSLKKLGIDFEERKDLDPTSIDLVSDSGVGISFKVAGEVSSMAPNIPQGEAGVAVEFTENGAFVFNAPVSYLPSIEDLEHLEEQIREAYKEGRWDSKWRVIVRLLLTPTVTILVSQSSKSKIELAAQGNINGGSFELGDAKIALTAYHQSGDVLKILTAKNKTPMFQVAGLSVSVLRILPFLHLQPQWRACVSMMDEPHVVPLFDVVTPEMARKDEAIAKSLHLELIY